MISIQATVNTCSMSLEKCQKWHVAELLGNGTCFRLSLGFPGAELGTPTNSLYRFEPYTGAPYDPDSREVGQGPQE